ncbi:MAG TPA: Rieske (2Fe-2S) protein [Ornithinibacter sp.]|nr:Rieske (2Fe-2S) protein [Ornithinibacter sp.]
MSTWTPRDQNRPSDPTEPGTTGCGCASRRESLLAAGVVVAGAAGLTACGSGEAVGEAASSAASAAASAAASVAGDAIAAASIPVGGGLILDNLKVVVTQPTAGDYKAFSAVCPHQGCTVTRVEAGSITCPCHGSTFDIATGAVTKGPATSGLEAKGVTVGADGITVT